MSLRSEDVRGWLGTITIHSVLAIILFLWKLDLSASEPEYIEVRWGSATDISTATPTRPSRPGSGGMPRISVTSKARSIDLPKRRFVTDEEVLRLPSTNKMAADEQTAHMRPQFSASSKGRKERGAGVGIEGDRKLTAPGMGENAGEVADPLGSGSSGSAVGKSVSMSIQWSDGGTRKKISGALPEYPAGVKVEAQIKLEITVLPDGSVKLLRPSQKGNMKLEEAAMKETRLWKFEPLQKSSPQRDQTCVATFNFRLR